ncbi:glycosyltransferase family 25 protein [Paenarthrobacter sp. DKR-5]|uniref:glycosyltransferase family 25 protein n=1 Tax=Paenarthrobacter sp. DKR-5 TaxID=2835535 RepID=UPI001BDCE9FD|nr:glycosyltransferase family 25 protein [Paenarthrobacter sp. DKR-5]MBT1004474.1 glycosyltransferase family 25 protein [Paenarthrobacter sp. DKR-5]
MIIGIPDRYRGHELERQLARVGISAKRVAGVIADELEGGASAYADQQVARLLLRRELTNGEIGCTLAHRASYNQLLMSGADVGLIFEDDARLVTEPPLEAMGTLLDSQEPRVLLLNWNPDWTFALPDDVRTGGLPHRCRIHEVKVPPIDASAYALNRAAAKVLLQNASRVNYVSDWPAQVAHRIKFFIAYPRPFRSDETAISNLQDQRDVNAQRYAERAFPKAVRLLMSMTHLRWVLHRGSYGSYGAYVQHELVRPGLSFLARKRGRRLYPDDESSPLVAG